ncbi:MAG: hypothetical protein J6N81_03935 [Treponema sp.]|nr:hypothetical protein [Treponema sp.]
MRVVQYIKVQFLLDKTVKAIFGALQEYEGQIAHVNKKQKIITACSFLMPDGKTFDLKF